MTNRRFKGWASDLDYLADECERQKKIEATVALYKREEKRPLERARYWQIGGLLLVLALVILARWSGALRSIGLP